MSETNPADDILSEEVRKLLAPQGRRHPRFVCWLLSMVTPLAETQAERLLLTQTSELWQRQSAGLSHIVELFTESYNLASIAEQERAEQRQILAAAMEYSLLGRQYALQTARYALHAALRLDHAQRCAVDEVVYREARGAEAAFGYAEKQAAARKAVERAVELADVHVEQAVRAARAANASWAFTRAYRQAMRQAPTKHYRHHIAMEAGRAAWRSTEQIFDMLAQAAASGELANETVEALRSNRSLLP